MQAFNRGQFRQEYQIELAKKFPLLSQKLMRDKTLVAHLKEKTDKAEEEYQSEVSYLMLNHNMDKEQAEKVALEIVYNAMMEFQTG
jgi:hypothetical protein